MFRRDPFQPTVVHARALKITNCCTQPPRNVGVMLSVTFSRSVVFDVVVAKVVVNIPRAGISRRRRRCWRGKTYAICYVWVWFCFSVCMPARIRSTPTVAPHFSEASENHCELICCRQLCYQKVQKSFKLLFPPACLGSEYTYGSTD